MRTSIVSSVAILSVCIGASRAESQTTSPPSTAVYGGAQARNVPNDGLGLSVQAYEGWDDNVLAGTTGSGSAIPSVLEKQSGFYSGAAAGLLYGHTGENASFRSWANTALAYYPEQSELTATYHQVGMGVAAPLGGRVSLHANSYFDYSPRYSIRLFPVLTAPQSDFSIPQETAAPTPDFNYTIVQRDSYWYGGNAGASISLTGRSSLGLAYGYGQTSSSDGLFDMQVRSASANFGYKISRNASLVAGYSRHEGRYERPNARHTVGESYNLGVNYQKPLSITRRTHLQFSTGSAVTQDLSGRRSVRAIGSAVLSHQIGRSWSTHLDYRRGVGYLDGINEPTFYDSAGVNVGGLISRRVEFSADARYFRGNVHPGSSDPFDTYSAWLRLRMGLTRSLAAYAEYSFYHYELTNEAIRPIGFPPNFDRNSVRVGLSLWVPLAGFKR